MHYTKFSNRFGNCEFVIINYIKVQLVFAIAVYEDITNGRHSLNVFSIAVYEDLTNGRHSLNVYQSCFGHRGMLIAF